MSASAPVIRPRPRSLRKPDPSLLYLPYATRVRRLLDSPFSDSVKAAGYGAINSNKVWLQANADQQ